MDINGLNSYFGLQVNTSVPKAERIATRAIARNDFNGDDRLSAAEFGKTEDLFNKIDTNSDSFVNQEELFTALQERIEAQTDLRIEDTLDIGVFKSSLGNLLAAAFGSGPDSSSLFIDTLRENIISGQNTSLSAQAREQFINAFAANSLANNGLPGSSTIFPGQSEQETTLSSLFGNQRDNRLLLYSLLVDGLGTPEDEANLIIDILESQSLNIIV